MRDSRFIALRSRTGARQTYLLGATYLEQNPDVHLKKAPTTERRGCCMCLFLSPTGQSQRLGIPSSLRNVPPSEIPVMAHQLLPSAPSYLRTFPSPSPLLPPLT